MAGKLQYQDLESKQSREKQRGHMNYIRQLINEKRSSQKDLMEAKNSNLNNYNQNQNQGYYYQDVMNDNQGSLAELQGYINNNLTNNYIASQNANSSFNGSMVNSKIKASSAVKTNKLQKFNTTVNDGSPNSKYVYSRQQTAVTGNDMDYNTTDITTNQTTNGTLNSNSMKNQQFMDNIRNSNNKQNNNNNSSNSKIFLNNVLKQNNKQRYVFKMISKNQNANNQQYQQLQQQQMQFQQNQNVNTSNNKQLNSTNRNRIMSQKQPRTIQDYFKTNINFNKRKNYSPDLAQNYHDSGNLNLDKNNQNNGLDYQQNNNLQSYGQFQQKVLGNQQKNKQILNSSLGMQFIAKKGENSSKNSHLNSQIDKKSGKLNLNMTQNNYYSQNQQNSHNNDKIVNVNYNNYQIESGGKKDYQSRKNEMNLSNKDLIVDFLNSQEKQRQKQQQKLENSKKQIQQSQTDQLDLKNEDINHFNKNKQNKQNKNDQKNLISDVALKNENNQKYKGKSLNPKINHINGLNKSETNQNNQLKIEGQNNQNQKQQLQRLENKQLQQQQNQQKNDSNKNKNNNDNNDKKKNEVNNGKNKLLSQKQFYEQIRNLTSLEYFQDGPFPQILDLYEIGSQIGKGSYAIVVYGKEKRKKYEVAIKRYQKKKLMEPGKMRNVRREVNILCNLSHPNVMKLYTIIDSDEHLNLVMELIQGVSLYTYLKARPQRRLSEDKCRRVFTQVVQGIQYLHKKRIVHRDIKLENLLIDEKKKVKIIDFGFSVRTAENQKLTSFCGTPSYMSPEIVSKKEYTGFPSDIWSLGILLFVLLCGCFPFRGENEKDLFIKIRKGKFDIPNHVPIGARILIQKILKVEESDRPLAQDILEDNWIKQGQHYN
ncbi:Protein kinase-like domain [Pseudocohnilembus persalinus]|uniref:Protein kinase-like domain n=1 Tax=Pseudocohnilembus persalinus TaxID=266149 RepID=A0A0V0R7X9_PSEPJ|nr:Protein kinase-like domain [Pseudocohnilembus persalinus]|eukprot:KRX10604.1 Protein kinase-like domain [Pseudocohnilembus persalinus]